MLGNGCLMLGNERVCYGIYILDINIIKGRRLTGIFGILMILGNGGVSLHLA